MTNELTIRLGTLRGVTRPASRAFFGVPYAEAPVGEGRFSAPRPAAPWSGVRDCTQRGPIAMQGTPFAPGVGAEGEEREDCLTLNVYTPACDGRARPVMFFVHGGGFIVGASSMPLYDGRALAEAHDVVVVSANYRLGCLGFLAPADAGTLPGSVLNAGLWDVTEALRWVRTHVADFGGDPACVTIFGESAGGSMVCLLLAHAPAQGLFHRAIAQSPVDPMRLAPHRAGARAASQLLEALELPPDNYAALRDVPFQRLKRAQAVVEARGENLFQFFPVADARVLPVAPGVALQSPQAQHVPLLIGYNRDEWNLFEAAHVAEWSLPLTRADAVTALEADLADRAGAAGTLFDVYTASRKTRGRKCDARSIVRAIKGDMRFRIGSTELAARNAVHEARTYSYIFSYPSPAMRGALGACHALELAFVFGTLDAPSQDRFAGTGEVPARLSREMMETFTSFARTAEPRPLSADFPRYEAKARSTLIFDATLRVEHDPFAEERAAFPV
jgi:para-nitrobenzyl esterase